MTFTPKFSRGSRTSPSIWGRPDTPIIRGDRRAVDVAIHQADPVGPSLLGQGPGEGAGQVDRESGFADPALAAGDGDDVLHLADAGVGGKLDGRGRGARGGAPLRDGDRDGDLGLPGAQGRQGGLDIGVELLRDLGVGRGHRQADGDLALGRDLDALEEAEGDDVSAEARVADLGQRLLDGILVECHEQD